MTGWMNEIVRLRAEIERLTAERDTWMTACGHFDSTADVRGDEIARLRAEVEGLRAITWGGQAMTIDEDEGARWVAMVEHGMPMLAHKLNDARETIAGDQVHRAVELTREELDTLIVAMALLRKVKGGAACD